MSTYFFKNPNVLEELRKHKVKKVLNLGSGNLNRCMELYYDLYKLYECPNLKNVDELSFSSIDAALGERFFIDTPKGTYNDKNTFFRNQIRSVLEEIIIFCADEDDCEMEKTVLIAVKNYRFSYVKKGIQIFLKQNKDTFDLIILSQVLSRMWAKQSSVNQNFNKILRVIKIAKDNLSDNGLIYIKLNCQKDLDQFNDEHFKIIEKKFKTIFSFPKTEFDKTKEIILKK